MSITGQTIVTDVFSERNVFAVGDTVPTADSNACLAIINAVLGLWNADGNVAFSTEIATHVMTSALQPHLIGPGGTTNFVVTPRPESIEGANIITGSGASAAKYHVWIRDKRWWQDLANPGTTSTIPTDLYYDPSDTNGSIYLHPIPSSAGTLELRIRRAISDLTLAGVFTLPQGYQRALTLTAAEHLPAAYGQAPPGLARLAAMARGTIFNANVKAPKISTRDYGMPGFNGGCHASRMFR